MRPYIPPVRRRSAWFSLVALLAFVTAVPIRAGTTGQEITNSPAESDPLTKSGFQHFYELEYDAAVADFEKVYKAHRDDAFAVNHLLNSVLFRELYRIGALDTQLYASNSFVTKKRFAFDPQVKVRVDALVNEALAISETRLKQEPKDPQALYTRGITRGLKASYLALVEKAWFSALRQAEGARHDHEKVLEAVPDFADAKTAVGAHNYIAGSLPFAVKVAVSLLGVTGSKQKGLELLRQAAQAGGETAVDAKIALALFLRREQRFDEALVVIRTLTSAYPRNPLFAIEEGNVLNAGGHGMQAIAVFQQVLEKGKQGYYKDPHLELAAFALGEALRGQKHYTQAAEAYELVSGFPHRDPELLQQAILAAGEMYDVEHQREHAIASYNAVIAADASSPEAEKARQFLRQPYAVKNP